MARKEKKYYEGVFYVYIHKRATDGKVFYVGKGTRDRAWEKSNRNVHWQRTVNKHGYTVHIVEEFADQDSAFLREIDLIKMYGIDNLTNMTEGGDGCTGFKPSEETRKKLSRARMGNQHKKGKKQPQSAIDSHRAARAGVPLTGEHRSKISEGLKRAWAEGRKKPINEDGRRKISEANTGRSVPEDVRRKMSIGSRGENNRWYDPTIRVFSHNDGRVVYCTKHEFREMTGIFIGDITAVINGRQKTVKGWTHLGVLDA